MHQNNTLQYITVPFLLVLGYRWFTDLYSGRRGRDRMVVGYTTTCTIRAYHH
jgi:hypothetical protein